MGKINTYIKYNIIAVITFIASACNVHQWPELPEKVALHLKLNFETNLTEWNHIYDDGDITELGFGETYDNAQKYGRIRYIIRAYPILDKQRSRTEYAQEFIFIKDVLNGYDHEVTLDLLPGNYNIMVWSDLIEGSESNSYYNADNFSEIMLTGEHRGNTNYRDAFRGMGNITLVSDVVEHAPETLNITMQRPLAKYELITTDLQEFIDKEMEYLAKEALTRGEEAPTRVDTDDYTVVLLYSGFMPNTYNMNTDKPVDSELGITFESKLNVLNSKEASLGFDYVFVNGNKSAVSVQVGLYDKSGRQIALSGAINIPLSRNKHTMLKGQFLIQQASGGININPDFDGNHNIIID